MTTFTNPTSSAVAFMYIIYSFGHFFCPFFYFFVLRWKDSMYHALGYSSILVMQATMTFEQRDIQAAMQTIKEALHTCQR